MKKIALFSLAFLLFTAVLDAATIKVNCGGQSSSVRYPQKIGNVLRMLNPQGPNTLNISGTCNENLNINQFDRLSLIAAPGAVIEDSSGGQEPVINITDSQRISIQGFTIRGGSYGVKCFDGSLCRFSGNTVERSTNAGVWVNLSQAKFSGDIIQDTGGPGGLTIDFSYVNAEVVTIRRSAESGIYNNHGSVLGAWAIKIQDNGAFGISVEQHSCMLLGESTVTNNSWAGIVVSDQSFVSLHQNTVTGNLNGGVAIGDSSLAELNGGGTFTGNTISDIGCFGEYSAVKNTQGATIGTMNCPIPPVPSANAGQTAPLLRPMPPPVK